ncbi:MAG: glycosyltransferase family 2 protein [Candidatus Firestonebacteria bacterium]|nr:glycosyltransferase family 2 protein [Candidatus Firestonebacteria bacterium]
MALSRKKKTPSLRSTAPCVRVSVIMPVYNTADYLPAAIESILKQTYRAFELILVDDQSRDRSPEILQNYARRDKRIRLLRNETNLKLSRTLNRAIEAARGEYLVRMDSDDVSLPDRIAKQVAYLDAHPEVGVAGGAMDIIDGQDRLIGVRRYALTDGEIRARLFCYSPFSHPTIILRKAVLLQAGLYDPAYNPAEDYELYFRLGRLAKFGNLADTLLRYRVVPKSMTTGSTRAMEVKTLEIRRRAVKEFGYRMTFFDKIYGSLQQITMRLMPGVWRVWLFNTLRGWIK